MKRRPTFAWKPVAVVTVALAVVLLVLAPAYGPHRDELYFASAGHRLAWGYPDQPSMVALLARVTQDLAGHSLLALRTPSVLAVCALARDVGRPGAAARWRRPGAGADGRAVRQQRRGARLRPPARDGHDQLPGLDGPRPGRGARARGRPPEAVAARRAGGRPRPERQARHGGRAAGPVRRGRRSPPPSATTCARPGGGPAAAWRCCCGCRTSSGRPSTAGRSSCSPARSGTSTAARAAPSSYLGADPAHLQPADGGGLDRRTRRTAASHGVGTGHDRWRGSSW